MLRVAGVQGRRAETLADQGADVAISYVASAASSLPAEARNEGRNCKALHHPFRGNGMAVGLV